MTPSELLTRAADLVRDTAAAAADGPWAADGVTVTTEDRDLNPIVGEGLEGGGGVVDAETARWIALASPAVAPALEAIFREAAHVWKQWEREREPWNVLCMYVGKQCVAAYELAVKITGESVVLGVGEEQPDG